MSPKIHAAKYKVIDSLYHLMANLNKNMQRYTH